MGPIPRSVQSAAVGTAEASKRRTNNVHYTKSYECRQFDRFNRFYGTSGSETDQRIVDLIKAEGATFGEFDSQQEY